jgi:hypothetical protein
LMPGKHATDHQVRRYMGSRKDGYSQAAAASPRWVQRAHRASDRGGSGTPRWYSLSHFPRARGPRRPSCEIPRAISLYSRMERASGAGCSSMSDGATYTTSIVRRGAARTPALTRQRLHLSKRKNCSDNRVQRLFISRVKRHIWYKSNFGHCAPRGLTHQEIMRPRSQMPPR